MLEHIAGPGLSFVGNWIQGQLNRDAVRQSNYENRVQADQANAENERVQKEFAQNSIRWKIEDAARAGINPLVALGATGTSYSGGVVAPQSEAESSGYVGGALAQLGQDVSRSASATATAEEREIQKMQMLGAQLDLEGKAIDNSIRAQQLHKLTSVGPPAPSLSDPMGRKTGGVRGQGDMPEVEVVPQKISASQPGIPGMDAGAINDYGFARSGENLHLVPSKDVKERIEDQLIPETSWALRNYVTSFPEGPTPPSTRDIPIPESAKARGAYRWQWNPLMFRFEPAGAPQKRYQVPKYAPKGGRLQY